MPKTKPTRCRACGMILAPEDLKCSRCKVARRGDANRPMIAAYSFFLFSALVAGVLTMIYLKSVLHLRW